MKTVNVSINLFTFEELTEQAKQKAIEEHRNFLLQVTSESDFEYQEDFESTIEDYEQNDENIIENILINDYVFFSTGDLANCVTYCGGHPKSGITELTYQGSVYQL